MIFHVMERAEFIARRDELKQSFALLDGVSGANEMFNEIMMAQYVVFATDGDLVAGTYCYGEVGEDSPCMVPELLERIGPDDVLAFPLNIYIRPEYRGGNLVKELQAVYAQDAIKRGFTHSVGYLPKTPEIKSWAEAQKDLIVIRPKPTKPAEPGKPIMDWITLRVLNNA